MILVKITGKIILALRRLKNKIISVYQLSLIPHGKGCSIRGGTSYFEGNISFGDYVTVGTDSKFLSSDARIIIGNKVCLALTCTLLREIIRLIR